MNNDLLLCLPNYSRSLRGHVGCKGCSKLWRVKCVWTDSVSILHSIRCAYKVLSAKGVDGMNVLHEISAVTLWLHKIQIFSTRRMHTLLQSAWRETRCLTSFMPAIKRPEFLLLSSRTIDKGMGIYPLYSTFYYTVQNFLQFSLNKLIFFLN